MCVHKLAPAGKSPPAAEPKTEEAKQALVRHSSDIQAAAAATLLALSDAGVTARTVSAQSHSKPQQLQASGSEPEINNTLAAAAAAAIATAYSKRHSMQQPPPAQPRPVTPAASGTPGARLCHPS